MNKLSIVIVSLFGIGFFPWASGTIASFFSIIFFYLVFDFLSFFNILLIFTIIFILSIIFIDKYKNLTNKHDSSEIVIDEFLGINLIFIFYEYFKFTSDIFMFTLIFLIFRFFDIIKFFPGNWIDKNIRNSWGVILDDIVAAVYCIITLFILNAFL